MRRAPSYLPLLFATLASAACGRAVLNTPDAGYVCDGEICTRPDVPRVDTSNEVDTPFPDEIGPDASDVPIDTRVPRCGDSILDPGEQCDDGNNNPGDGCTGACRWEARCGDGRMDPGEICDDGNNRSADGCRSDCLSNEQCGNGIVDLQVGEVCDGTMNCAADCRSILGCGDGTVGPGEQCDDGNTTRWDGCSAECLREQGIGMEAFFIAGNTGRVGCDFSGDGRPDNAFGRALGMAAGILNTAITNGISNGQFILQLGFIGLRDPLGVNENNIRVGWMRGLDGDMDTMNNGDPGNPQDVSAATLNMLGLPQANYQSNIVMTHLDGGPEDIFLDLPGPMGMPFSFHLAHSTLHGTVSNDGMRIARFGSLPDGTNDGTHCGAVVARDLAMVPNFFGMIAGGGGGDRGTFLEALVGGYSVMIPIIGSFAVGPQQPDVDLDGDGLEFYVATPGSGRTAPRITACIDGNGMRIDGEMCQFDPRMADGFTGAFQAYGPWIQFVGVR
jgi:cysteine-rich repeat protein